MRKYNVHLPIRFVHKTQKFSIFGLTWGHKRSLDSVTVLTIFLNLVSKDAQDLKEKKAGSSVAWNMAVRISRRELSRGGLMAPSVFLGLKLKMMSSALPPPPQCARMGPKCAKIHMHSVLPKSYDRTMGFRVIMLVESNENNFKHMWRH